VRARQSDHDRRVPLATKIEWDTSILGLTDKLPLAYAVRELNPRQCGREHQSKDRPGLSTSQRQSIYRQSITLVSGRFAMLSDGFGFALVPWRPVIERSLGRAISAVAHGDRVTWHLGRLRGISL
jgi:hypothetical protein